MIQIVDLHAGKLGARIAAASGATLMPIEHRHFPDGESYLRVLGDPRGAQLWIVADLVPADATLFPVLLLAASLREQGAARVGLIAPYLPYMRQDIAFQPGECVSARHMAAMLGAQFDALITVDAHLHRIDSLEAVFGIPARNLGAAGLLADWVAANVDAPLLVGPDAESAQWVEAGAARIGCPWTVLSKERNGDRDVRISGRLDARRRSRNPVLIDDVLSTGSTLVQACALLAEAGLPPPRVAVVHAIFADEAEARLREAGVVATVSTDSLPHHSNQVSLAALIAQSLGKL